MFPSRDKVASIYQVAAFHLEINDSIQGLSRAWMLSSDVLCASY